MPQIQNSLFNKVMMGFKLLLLPFFFGFIDELNEVILVSIDAFKYKFMLIGTCA